MNTDLLFSSKSDDWSTPLDFFEKVKAEFGEFDLDVCASKGNAKAKRFFSKEQDGLGQFWNGLIWMNPPYGRGIGKWVEKAYKVSLTGNFVVCLLPARTDTKWFHDFCTKGEVRFIKGRLKFGSSKNAAPFPSMLVIFKTPNSQYW